MRLFLKKEIRCKLSVALALVMLLGVINSGNFMIVLADTSDNLVVGSVTPGDGSVTPGDGSVSPGDGSVSPGDGSVSPGDGSVSPGDGSVSPGDGSVSPGDGSVSPGDGSVSPGDGVLLEDSGFAFEQYGRESHTINYSFGSFVNTVSGGNGRGEVTYSSSDDTIATVDSSGEVSFIKKGFVQITATRESDGIYKAVSTYYLLYIEGMEQADFAFAESGVVAIDYEENLSYSNPIEGGIGTAVTYSIAEGAGSVSGNVATINRTTGEVTVLKAGTVTVTASIEGNDYYKEASASYTLRINKGTQKPILFTNSPTVTLKYSKNQTYTNVLTSDGSGTGELSYSIADENGRTGNLAATIDTVTGQLTFQHSGTVIVTATRAADECYLENSNSYTLIIERGNQNTFGFATPTPEQQPYSEGGYYVNVASGGSGFGKVTYSIADTEGNSENLAASIDSQTGRVDFIRTGTVVVTATKAQDANYNSCSASYTLEIIKGEQSAFAFTTAYPDMQTYTEEGYYENTVKGVLGNGATTYSIIESHNALGNEDMVATVDAASGRVTFLKAGTIKVKAFNPGDNNYNAASDIYTLQIQKGDQSPLAFSKTGFHYIEYGKNNNIYVNEAYSNGTVIGENEIVYTLTDTNGDTTDIAAVHSQTGQVSVFYKGSVIITATRAEDERYHGVTASYTLTINEGKQNSFYFIGEEPGEVQLADGSYYRPAVGGSGDGTVEYSIIASSAEGVAEIVNTDDAEQPRGTVIFHKPGHIKVEAKKEGGRRFGKVTAAYELTIMGDQDVAFESTKQPGTGNILENHSTIYYGQSLNVIANLVSKSESPADGIGHGNGAFTYEVVSGGDIAILENGESGELKFQNQKTGSVCVRAKAEADYQAYYNYAQADYVVNVEYLPTPQDAYTVSGNQYDGWYTGEVSIYAPEGYLISYENDLDVSQWEECVKLTQEEVGVVSGKVVYLKKRDSGEATDGGITDGIEVEPIYRDTTAPKDLKITYQQSLLDTALRTLSFGLYQGSVEVTLSAVDEESGLKSFEYSYKVTDGVDKVNQGKENVKVQLAEGESSYRFTIPAQFRGKVSFTAMNNAGMGYSLGDNKEIIVDDLNPVCQVDFLGDYVAMTDAEGDQVSVSGSDTRYIYNSEVTATIKITEANFDINDLYDQDVIVNVYRDGAQVTEGVGYFFEEEDWAYIEEGNYYKRSIVFGKDRAGNFVDGDYVMEIGYTDALGNEMESYRSHVHCVNTESLDISISYDNNTAYQGNYYNKSRTATITLTGRNIKLDNVRVAVTAENRKGEVPFDLETKMSDWEVVQTTGGYPSKWQTTITYDMDATYAFQIQVKDLAGHETGERDSFTVDHTAPDASEFVFHYSEPSNKFSEFINQLLSAVTFRYYNNSSARIEVTAEDATSGIDKLYLYYKKQDGSSSINVDKLEEVALEPLTYNEDGSVASGAFTLPGLRGGQYRGNVGLKAVDRAGNVSDLYMDNGTIVVVDNIAPVCSVEYSPAKQEVNNNNTSVLYYDSKMTMTFTVQEANFYPDDVVMKVNEKAISGVQWKQKGDVWTGILTLSDEGDYVVRVDYKDRSNNEMESYTSKQITIDNHDPVVSVAYSPSASKGTYDGRAYYDTPITATITINEHNFRASDVEAVVTAQDIAGSGVAVSDYASYLKNESSWVSKGDVHTAVITFHTDANYSFDIGYKDLALRNAADYPAYLFAVDQINPGNLSVAYSQSILDIVMQSITFGYYNAPVAVTMTAQDNTAGISKFEYSYLKAEGVSGVNAGKEQVTIASNEITYSENKRTATAVFSIPSNELKGDSQFNGTVKFVAYDRAGRNTGLDDSRRIIVDNIAPTASITFNDPVKVANEVAYYAGNVDGVIRITEANFVPEDVVVTVNHDGSDFGQVQVTWSDESVDEHVGRFQLSDDGNYVVRVEYKDRSGNEMAVYQSNQIIIDTKKPQITITGVANHSASREEQIGFVVTVEDENLDAASFQPLLTAETVDAEGNFRQVDMSSAGKSSTVIAGEKYTYTVDNLDADGIYNLTCKVSDMAGNEAEGLYVDASGQEMNQLQFSVNRNGSTYHMNHTTRQMMGAYIKNPMDIEITEINATELFNIKITLFKNDKTIVLEEGKDFRVDVTGGNGEWYTYTYTIFKKNFEDDGVYRISIYSEDEAGNAAENTLDVKGLEITFAVDKTSPNLIIANLESNTTYPYDNYTVMMQAGDNLKLELVEVKLDGKVYRSWNAEEIGEMEKESSEYTFDISGSSTRAHNLEVRLVDAAANEVTTVVSNFYVTTDKWVQFYNNKLLFYGSIGGAIVVVVSAAGIIALASHKRRKES